MRNAILAFGLILSVVAPIQSFAATIVKYQFKQGPSGAAVSSAVDGGPFHLDGTPTGTLTYSSDVRTGGGKFSLNKTADFSYVSVPDAAPFHQTGNFTLSVLAKPTGGQNPTGDLIAGKLLRTGYGACLTSYAIFYSYSLQKFSAQICPSDNDASQGFYSTDTFPPGQWYKVVLKYSYSAVSHKTTITETVNGKVQGKLVITTPTAVGQGSGPFNIGAGNFGSGDHDFYRRNFIGFVDEVKLIGTLP